jgi:tetratricopeptide (TPR) repeat protein
VGERLEFYRRLLPARKDGPVPLSPAVTEEILAAAVCEDRYLQLRRQQPEETLLKAISGPTTREAVQALERLAERHPHYLNGLQHLGRMLNDLHEHKNALRFLERALPLNPQSARTLCEIGRAQYNLGDDRRAHETLESALTLNPYFQVGWQYLLRMCTILPSGDGRRWAEMAQQLHPANFALALLGVKVYPPGEAVAVLHRLVDFYAPSFLAEELPAAAAAFSETIRDVAGPLLDTSAVLELVRRGCGVFPQSALLAHLHGRALHLAGNYEEANDAFARALALRRAALTYRQEFPRENGTVHFWQFAEHLRSLKEK